jgi:hypothetical protein
MLHLAAKITIDANDIGVPKSTGTIGDGLANITAILMSVIGMLAIVFILVGAIQMATSAGDPTRYKRARETLLYAIVGLALSVAAYAIVKFITHYVK